MNTSDRIPSLLSPYILLPRPGSLGLVTSTVSTTANWVLLRYLYAALGGNAQSSGLAADGIEAEDVGVILVSWMRDLAFWKTEARRAVSIDLGRLQQQGRFAFVDGLSSLSTTSAEAVDRPNPLPALPSRTATSTRSPLPTRGPAPSRGPPRQPDPTTANTSLQSAPPGDPSQHAASPHTLTSPTLSSIQSTITNAISALKTKHVLLILDTPSLLLHTTNPPITASQLTALLLTLRSHPQVHSTITAIPADKPFLAPAEDAAVAHLHSHRLNPGSGSGFEPLAIDNAAFMVSVAHMAKWVLSCRMLGTGWAEDVSGVVRVTRGGSADVDDEGYGGNEVKEGEWLYHVGGDASAKVWGRGESGR